MPTLYVNWSFWPAFHVLNFRFVPPADRILYINAVQVLFNVFLCWQASKREEEGADDGGSGSGGAGRAEHVGGDVGAGGGGGVAVTPIGREN